MSAFHAMEGSTTGKETVIIPCFHPGFLGHAGILKEKATRLLIMISGIAWKAVTSAIVIHRENILLPRKDKCESIIKEVESKLDPSHKFGAAFARAKAEYLDVVRAWHQGKLTRQKAEDIPKPPRGILRAKSARLGKSRTDRNAETVGGDMGGWEVLLQEQTVLGPKSDNKRHSLSWLEDDGQKWSIGPVILPENVLPITQNDKRFIFL